MTDRASTTGPAGPVGLVGPVGPMGIDPGEPEYDPIKAPSLLLRLAEVRAPVELGTYVALGPLLRALRRSDRHPVLVLPGFTAGDASTLPLRWVLRGQGYWTHRWHLGSNMGPTDHVMKNLRRRLVELHKRHDKRVSVVGWSLGGIYARELAREQPSAVRQVITLGSPFRLTHADRTSASFLTDRMPDRFNEQALSWALKEPEKPPLPVPSTAIYTRTDGVVRWHMCIDVQSEHHENIEVRGSHSGLGLNPAVLYALTDRLAQPEDGWRTFRPPPPLRPLYPTPVSWEDSPATAAGRRRSRGR